jgi:hypothetical protein
MRNLDAWYSVEDAYLVLECIFTVGITGARKVSEKIVRLIIRPNSLRHGWLVLYHGSKEPLNAVLVF